MLSVALLRSVNNSINQQFVSEFHTYMGSTSLLTNDPMEAHYIGFKMWVAAVLQAGTYAPFVNPSMANVLWMQVPLTSML